MTSPMESSSPQLRLPARIGRYTDLHVLGRGGMGAVYRAYDPELDRPVAIKVMLHSTPEFLARFRREAQSIARLTHGNVVQVYDFGVDEDGNPYFVMELVEGTPLDQLLRERGRLPIGEACELARQSALGLAAAHRAGIIHRDVKPSNLIVDARGGVKIVDFGIARASASAQLTAAASLMGTPGYMAPEQAQGKSVDHRADIYALGLTLFEMLAGDAPFVADDPIALVVMNMQEPLPDLRARPLGLPVDLIAVVEQMAQKSPDARLQSCDAVARALEPFAVGGAAVDTAPDGPLLRQAVGVASPSVPPTNVQALPSDPPSPRRRGLALAFGAALAVGGIGVALVLLLSPGHPPALKIEPAPLPPAGPAVEKHAAKPPSDPATGIAGAALVPGPRPVADGPLRVAILKFQNVGKDPKLDQLAGGIGETAITDMLGVAPGRLALLERNDLESDIGELDRGKDDHFDKATVAQKGQLAGVHVAVQGGFQRAGKVVRVTARFVRVETGEIIDTLRHDGRARDALGLQDEIAKQLRAHVLLVLDRERPTAKGTAP